MVDSGSDIVTLTDDIIEELHLPKIGWCEQEGADGIKQKKPFYSACLGIGEKKINVKVRFTICLRFIVLLQQCGHVVVNNLCYEHCRANLNRV